jgi:hypothetical protein
MSDVVDPDPFFFELLLQDEPLVTLREAARAMHGVEFLHGATGQTQRFDFEVIKQTLDVCLEWAQVHGPEDARSALGVHGVYQPGISLISGSPGDKASTRSRGPVTRVTCQGNQDSPLA